MSKRTTSVNRNPHHVDRKVDKDHLPLLKLSDQGNTCSTCDKPVEIAEK